MVELAASVKGRHDHLQRRDLHVGVPVDRDAAAVVRDRDSVVLADDHVDLVAVAGQRFVHRVVDYLVDEMVQPALRRIADVHGRALAYGLQALEYLDRGGVVATAAFLGVLGVLGVFCGFHHVLHCLPSSAAW